MYYNPEIIEYSGDRGYLIGVIYKDHYCNYGQFIFQPIKKFFWKFYLKDGKDFYTWDKCLKER